MSTAGMIIFGSCTLSSTTSSGTFHCPLCQTPRQYQELSYRRWFTLYFIPLIPLDKLGAQVSCLGCGSTFDPAVLVGDEVLVAEAIDPFGNPQTNLPFSKPQPATARAPATSALANTSLILTILSPILFCVCNLSLLTSLGAIVTGHMALSRIALSAGQLTGRGRALVGTVGGYFSALVSIGILVWFVTMYGRDLGENDMAAARSETASTAEERLTDIEIQLTSKGDDGIASGNTPEAEELAQSFSELLKEARENLFTADKKRIVSLTGGEFLTHCELHHGTCAFIVHVPSYRNFNNDAKEALATISWTLAQAAVIDTLEPGDELAVGLRGTLLYGAILIGEVGIGEDFTKYESGERSDLLRFFPVPSG